ncbi:MAG: 4-hydroxy-tetrahydrodipicolinate reductase [Clostridia bacterium]|nr:4-hydroxy-tetrahydrodipicolinate reductase [Clostridia bacterium]
MKILICGVGGRMGREVAKLALDGMRGAVPVAGFDLLPVDTREFPTYTEWSAITETPDCIIDFSHHAGTAAMLEHAVEKRVPVVLATTGHTEEETEVIRRASEAIPIFHSANMSLGIALLVELAKTAAKAFPEADIEIVEKHHNRKLDAPSGTALLLARELQEVREDATLICGRSGHAKREKNEIGIHAIRMGNIVGEHEVIIGTDSQTITLKHEAHSRSLFAEGAIAAADFLIGKPEGLYDMKRMLEEA